MLRTLILCLICTSSLVKGLIFSFIPGGGAIRNLITPFLNRLNTTDANGNPTFAANKINLIDPILAMQFAQNDLVSSPEDYRKFSHPYNTLARNPPDFDQTLDYRYPFLDRHFCLPPSRYDYPHLPYPPRDPFEFSPYDYRNADSLLPSDHYLNDYVYTANEDPLSPTYRSHYESFAGENLKSNSQPGDMLSTAHKMFVKPKTVGNRMSPIYRSRYGPFVYGSSLPNFADGDFPIDALMNIDYLESNIVPLSHAYFSRYGPFVQDYGLSDYYSDTARSAMGQKFGAKDAEKLLNSQTLQSKNYPPSNSFGELNDRLSDSTSRAEHAATERNRQPNNDIFLGKNILSNSGLSDKLSSLSGMPGSQGIDRYPLRHWLEESNHAKYPWPSNNFENLGVENVLFDNNYEPGYDPYSSSMLGSNSLLEDSLFDPVDKMEDAMNRYPSRLPFNVPYGTNNINYGIVEPNFGNYPIYSFDNTNPIQNFNNQNNPSFNTANQPNKVPVKFPSTWSLIHKPKNIASLSAPEDDPKALFTANDLFNPQSHSEEDIKYLQSLTRTPLGCPPVAPTNLGYNEDGIRTDWPADPKSLFREATEDSSRDEPQRIDLPTQAENSIPALMLIPESNPGDLEDPTLRTIMSNKTYNFLPIQLTDSSLSNIISNVLFSMLFKNPPDGDIITTASNPRSYSLLNPKKHKIQLYDPTLRGYHGAINPFAHKHKGIGYKRPRVR